MVSRTVELQHPELETYNTGMKQCRQCFRQSTSTARNGQIPYKEEAEMARSQVLPLGCFDLGISCIEQPPWVIQREPYCCR